jgi:hypothetical protein
MADEKTLGEAELETRWTALRSILDGEGSGACCASLMSEPDDVVRNQLFRFAIRKLGGGTGATAAELDAMVVIGEAAITNALNAAQQRPHETARWQDEANISLFNLSANLCDCWGDGDTREQRHFEAGVQFADRALDLRRQLRKGPGPFAMAYWARGKHLLSLKRPLEAADAFRSALAKEQEVAKSREVAPQPVEAVPGVLMERAFLGFSLMRADKKEGAPMLEAALNALRAILEKGEGEIKDDAQLYVDEIQETMRRN